MTESPPWPHDVVGLLWEEAEPILTARGLRYETVITRPPNRPIAEGPLRVVAERQGPDRLLLVLAHRDYRRQASPSNPAGQGG